MLKYVGALGVMGSLALAAAPAQAQTAGLTGDELYGQTVDVMFSDGTRNAVSFGSNGVAQIAGSDGSSANANWFVNGGKLCLQNGTTGECWDYNQRFEAGRTYTLASSCDETSQWVARGVNPIRQQVAPVMQGERG